MPDPTGINPAVAEQLAESIGPEAAQRVLDYVAEQQAAGNLSADDLGLSRIGPLLAQLAQSRVDEQGNHYTDPTTDIGEALWAESLGRRHGLGPISTYDFAKDLSEGKTRDYGADAPWYASALSELQSDQLAADYPGQQRSRSEVLHDIKTHYGDTVPPDLEARVAAGSLPSEQLAAFVRRPDEQFDPGSVAYGRNALDLDAPQYGVTDLPAMAAKDPVNVAGGIGTSAALGYGLLQNPLGALARAALALPSAQTAFTTDLPVVRPKSAPGISGFADGSLETQLGIGTPTESPKAYMQELAEKHGITLGGYADPAQFVNKLREQAKIIADSKRGTPEGDAAADDFLARENANIDGLIASIGPDGLSQIANDAVARRIAGYDRKVGRVDDEGNPVLDENGNQIVDVEHRDGFADVNRDATMIGNALSPRSVMEGQMESIEKLKSAFSRKPPVPVPGMPPAPAAPPVPMPGVPPAAVPAGVRPSWMSRLGNTLGSVVKPISGAFGVVQSMPGYVNAASQQADLTASATDNNPFATYGTTATSLAGQGIAGEYLIPKAMLAGMDDAGKALGQTVMKGRLPFQASGNIFGRALLDPFRRARDVVQAARAAGTARTAGGLLSAGVRGVRGAAPGMALASMATDAALNSDAAFRNIFANDSNFWGGGSEGVRNENRAMADQTGWNKDNANAWDITKGVAGSVFTPVTATREIAGAVDQNREMIRDTEYNAQDAATRNAMRNLTQLNKARAAVAQSGGDTTVIDNAIRQAAKAPRAGAWGDVAKWQQGGWDTWFGGGNRAQMPWQEQIKKMDSTASQAAFEILEGVKNGTVDPERARVALGIPAMQDWSPAEQANNPEAIARNQRHVLTHVYGQKGANMAQAQWTPTNVKAVQQQAMQPRAQQPAAAPAQPAPQPQQPQVPVPAPAPAPAPAAAGGSTAQPTPKPAQPAPMPSRATAPTSTAPTQRHGLQYFSLAE